MVWVGDGETGKGEAEKKDEEHRRGGDWKRWRQGDGVRKRLKDERPASNVEGEK